MQLWRPPAGGRLTTSSLANQASRGIRIGPDRFKTTLGHGVRNVRLRAPDPPAPSETGSMRPGPKWDGATTGNETTETLCRFPHRRRNTAQPQSGFPSRPDRRSSEGSLIHFACGTKTTAKEGWRLSRSKSFFLLGDGRVWNELHNQYLRFGNRSGTLRGNCFPFCYENNNHTLCCVECSWYRVNQAI